MPYIKQKDRSKYDAIAAHAWMVLPDEDWEGDLNYLITQIISHLWRGSPKYKTACRIRGTLTDVRDEFYRRVVAPYEDKKKEENGDVY